jgi:hypothetical protein
MTLWRVTRPLRRGLRRCFRWGCYGTLAAAAFSLMSEISRKADERPLVTTHGDCNSGPEYVDPKMGKERII